MVIAAVWLAGCGAARPATPVAAPGVPFLALRFESTLRSMDLVELHVALDGQSIFDRSIAVPESGEYEPIATPLCAARVPLTPGPHRLRVNAIYRGRGYGVFAYLRGLRLPLRDETEVELSAGEAGLVVHGRTAEPGGPTAPITDPPTIRWTVEPAREPATGCTP